LERDQFNKLLGKNIQEVRSEVGLTQEDLAHNSGMCRTYIGAIERGEKTISAYKLYKISNALGIDVATLLNKL
jgi:transcriptional regulator with XRE-family HTH domain